MAGLELTVITKYVKFFVWLPWFMATLPWQLRRAYNQVWQAISINDNLQIDSFEDGYTPRGANRLKKARQRRTTLKAS